jgi:hypothetical protein
VDEVSVDRADLDRGQLAGSDLKVRELGQDREMDPERVVDGEAIQLKVT